MRITTKTLENLVSRLNAVKGFENPERYTVGSYRLDYQNGYINLVKIVNDGGGVSVVGAGCGMNTKECYYFINGILANL